ncbi:hypothetical protein GCM10009557_29510 [Virgisporangium ochraceum]|uniref:Uncharacterized protein n=1 Tax=Virgisporangium ochraceum TaxID=65505 RepID=A0A8J4A3D7_9ACTN|nr:hypothetical protein [Virgisporangium ochraceum]GIJ75107.1 hypothetical protein Voc01_100240 [Virgisporangium ochraceum]
MNASDWIALFAAAVALGSVALHLWLRRLDQQEAQHTSVMTALQGEKEAVGYEAYRIGAKGWPQRLDEREQLRDALCLAFIFEGSDRTRAMIYRALKEYPRPGHPELEETLTKLLAVFEEADDLGVDWDLHRGWKRLAMLGKMLGAAHVAETATRRLRASSSQDRRERRGTRPSAGC